MVILGNTKKSETSIIQNVVFNSSFCLVFNLSLSLESWYGVRRSGLDKNVQIVLSFKAYLRNIQYPICMQYPGVSDVVESSPSPPCRVQVQVRVLTV